MSNKVRNLLSARETDFHAIILAITNNDGNVEFEKIIPTPHDCKSLSEWRKEHWGTSCNAEDTEVSGCELRFTTAWSAPLLIIERLSTMFPAVAITFMWSDECAAQNDGHILYRDGNEVKWLMPDTEEESIEVYRMCWGLSPYYEEGGTDIA